jgi:p-methyltransferase
MFEGNIDSLRVKERGQLDALIIGGDIPDEYLGKDERQRTRLTVDGHRASLNFLERYFAHGRNAAAAQADLLAQPLPFVSLNGPYLQAVLSRNGLEAALVPLLSQYKELMKNALQRRPRAVVFSTTFLPFAAHIDALAAHIKQIAPETVVIAGGIQIWKSYKHRELLESGAMEESIRDAVGEHSYFTDPTRPSPVDIFVVSPTGEQTLAKLLTHLRDGIDYSHLPNLALYRDEHWTFTQQEAEPVREVSVNWSQVVLPEGRVYIPVQAGEGCGFQCAFCDFSGLRPIQLRTTESIITEIRTIPPVNGIRRVYFTDDNLFATRERAIALCHALINSGMTIRWRGMIRMSIVTEAIATLMAQSGCLEVLLGIESGATEVLRNMVKATTPEQILRGLQFLSQAGIHTKSTFIVGFPGETPDTLQQTIDLLNAYPTDGSAVHRYLFFRFGVLPLSRVASPESRRKFKLRGYGYNWKHATMTSEEAAAMMHGIPDQLKPELNPNYVMELPELPGMSNETLKQVVLLRNLLARDQRNQPSPLPAPQLWDQLEACMATTTHERPTRSAALDSGVRL